jgi:hypothetical protein
MEAMTSRTIRTVCKELDSKCKVNVAQAGLEKIPFLDLPVTCRHMVIARKCSVQIRVAK